MRDIFVEHAHPPCSSVWQGGGVHFVSPSQADAEQGYTVPSPAFRQGSLLFLA